MRFTFTRTQAALACALALGAFSANVGAQDVYEHMIVTSSNGQPVMTGFGECVHSGFSSPSRDASAPHDVRVAFDNGSTRNVQTDYQLHNGDRVATVSDGTVVGYDAGPLSTARCHPAVASAPAPVYADKTIPPAPLVVAAAAAPIAVYEKVIFDVNVLFDSNKYNLLPAGRDQLDGFVGKIKGLEAQQMLAVGYADRMGSDASNQTLSENRVNTVKAYLVSQGVSSKRVDTSARGEREPTTWAAECKDANTPKNVACMQPDRHVFIEISGSRRTQ